MKNASWVYKEMVLGSYKTVFNLGCCEAVKYLRKARESFGATVLAKTVTPEKYSFLVLKTGFKKHGPISCRLFWGRF